jgi:NTE family protein/lysophospholipid hydrolase
MTGEAETISGATAQHGVPADVIRLLGCLAERLPALHAALLESAADLSPVSLAAGATLLRKGEPAQALYVVADGTLRASIAQHDGTPLTLSEFGAGEMAGEMAILAGDDAYTATVSAVRDALLVEVPRAVFERIVARAPAVAGQLAAGIRRRVARDQLVVGLQRLVGALDEPLLRFVESRVEWLHLRAGEVLFNAGDTSDELYFVVGGRLRAITADGRALNEASPGESVGEVALLSGEPRSATVLAVRDSELVRVSRQAFDEIVAQYPRVMETIARIVVRRLRAKERPAPATSAKCIAVLAAGSRMPTGAFCERLSRAFESIGPTLHLTSARFRNLLDRADIPDAAEDEATGMRVTAWLDDQESRFRYLIYEAHAGPTAWTRRCLRQADEVVLVAEAASDATPGETERLLLAAGAPSQARCTLVLLHEDGRRMPAGTTRWFAGRNVHRHFHVRLDSDKDFRRAARCIAGVATGIVFGGGGARGLAHVGVIRALREAGVAMDMIGGTSMGAVMAGLIGMDLDWKQMLEINRDAWLTQKPHKEYGPPVISLIRSRRLDRVARQIWGELAIEDLWLNYFCVSCNLSTSEMLVHERGSLWKAIRASASLPGVFVPVLDRGSVLVDGGVVNNLPGDVMRERACRRVVVVDVGSEREFTYALPEIPSPWAFLRSRVLPFTKPVKVFNIGDIMLRTTDVASSQRTREVKKSADLCLRPPIDRYGVLEFESLDEIVDVGYRYGIETLEALRDDAAFGALFTP